MKQSDIQEEIAQLLVNTGQAHHQAFIETDGADPEWPLWYADYVQKELGTLLDTELTKSELTYAFVRLDKEQKSVIDKPWSQFYAQRLLNWYT